MIQQKVYICSVADCGNPGVGRCSRCKVRYCGEDCQADDWPRHMRFCLPLPPLEYPESEQPSQVIDISDSTDSGNTVMAGSVILGEIQQAKEDPSPGDQSTPSKKMGGTDQVVKKKKEENNNVSAPLKESDMVPKEVESAPSKEVGLSVAKPKEEDDKEPEPVPMSVPMVDDVPFVKQVDASFSPQMAAQKVSAGLQEIDILPSVQIVSPAEFSISLVAEGHHYVQLVGLLSDKPPAADLCWSVGRKEPVLVFHEEFWQRGLAIKKKGKDYDVFLLDGGQTVTVSQENMRSLSSELRKIPPFIYQVCLAGVAPKEGGKYSEEEIENFKTVMSEPTYPIMVEFLGQLPGGRWLVRMEGKEDSEDVAKFLVESGYFAAGEIPPVAAPAYAEPIIQVPAPVQKEVVKGPIIGKREELEEGCEGTIRSLGSPDTVHIFPSIRQNLFLSIMEQAQAATLQGEVDPVLGTSCLAKDPGDNLYYRSEILEVNKEERKALLFQIDNGKMVQEDIKMLKPIPNDLAQEARLLTQVSIRGIKPMVTWTDEQEEFAKVVMDVGGSTIFKFSEVKLVDSKLMVNARDNEETDLASLLLGVGLPAENSFDRTSLGAAVLEAGKQEFVVLSCLSPLEIYLSSKDNLSTFNETGCVILDNIGKNSDFVHLPNIGQLVLVHKENCWNRAEVVEEILASGNILVQLLDFPEVLEVDKSQLRQAPQSTLGFPVLAAKCALDCFYGKEEEAYKQVEKLRSLDMDFQILEGEVLSSQDGLTRVKIPAIESKLVEPEPAPKSSREAMLKKLLKK